MAALVGQQHRHGHGNMQHQCHGHWAQKAENIAMLMEMQGTRKGKIACKGTCKGTINS